MKRFTPSPRTLAASAVCFFLFATACSAFSATVRDFGAVGDGVTDDTDAIQAAANDSTAGTLLFPRGDYRITKTIEIDLAERGRTGLSGDGGSGRVIMEGSGPAFRFTGNHRGTANPASVREEIWQNERMPQVEGLEISGAHPEADGLEFIRVMQAIVRGVLIREVRHGILLTERNRNVIIDSCHIYKGSGVGIFFDDVNLHQVNITGSHISYFQGGGIKVLNGEIRNLQITGNDIEYNYDPNARQSADIWIDVSSGSVEEGTISGNTIQAVASPGGANIRFIGPENPEPRGRVGLWSISGNLIGSQSVNVHLKHVRGVVLSGNMIYSGLDRTLLIEGSRHIVVGPHSFDQSHNYNRRFTNGITVRDSDGITFQGIQLEKAGAGSEEEGGAIEIFNSREVSIIGCQIFEPEFRGIYVSGGRNIMIQSSQVLDRTDEPTMLAAIEITGESTGAVVEGNIVGEGSRGAVIADPMTVIVDRNHPSNPPPSMIDR